MWSAFAGRVESSDDLANPEAIAARECYEESMGVLGSAPTLAEVLKEKGTRVDVSDGIHFLLPLVHDENLPRTFSDVRAKFMGTLERPDAYSPFLEKDQVAWVRVEDLKRQGRRYRRGFWRDMNEICDRLRDASCAVHPASVSCTEGRS
jgi:hypothetical protein